ncbi:MAG TPA: aldehyde dehydrogenase (NADP(+)) [Terriglobia bacterium]|nr:aldehyde dehydrogenase (NADP(+)) [Terriglobia bacterium]
MKLHGKSVVAGKAADSTAGFFNARGDLARFEEATAELVHQAFDEANPAFIEFRRIPSERRAGFLERIGEHIESLGDELLTTASTETSLPIADRLVGERARTVNQLRMFAALIREGSWVDARLDKAIPDRRPVPKPEIRRMLIPIGPVTVFAASNFPLAFSVAGGDTASALAAGCPVIVKAHPAHPATSELVAGAIVRAAGETGMPAGVFSLLQSTRNEISIAAVRNPFSKAVAFTGSLRAGRAIFDAAVSRVDPIPVYAEMGSINPVFILPGALRERAETIAQGMKTSVMLGGGQFCTSPGLAVGIGTKHFSQFAEALQELMRNAPPPTMLHAGILQSFEAGVERFRGIEGVRMVASAVDTDRGKAEATPAVFAADFETFQKHHALSEELFGPSTLLVQCSSREQMLAVAEGLEGHLTATIHGTVEDLMEYADLLMILERKVGRLIFNGFPTGVEVCPSMHHGGPYPATTDSRSTSVGTAAILRFARPVAFQNFPQAALPVELQDANARGIWRLVDGQLTREPLQ